MSTDQKPWRAEMPRHYQGCETLDCCRYADVKSLRDRCNAELDAARARIAELEAAQQWRPMETAPKTDERIIVWPRKGPPDVVVYFAGDRWAGGRSDYFTPQLIAWLPLPEPPKEGA